MDIKESRGKVTIIGIDSKQVIGYVAICYGGSNHSKKLKYGRTSI